MKPQLAVLLLLVPVSLAVWTRVTVTKGETLRLRCPVSNAHRSHVEWKNPEGFLMFFNHNRALKDKRYSINKLSQSHFSISISNIGFKDGGNYTCTQYDRPAMERTVEVTVIGRPRVSVARHKDKISLKCSAQANSSPPLISWTFDDGLEFTVGTRELRERKKFESESWISLTPPQSWKTVRCLVRHPALNSDPLTDFVSVGPNPGRSGPAVSTSPPTTPPPSSTPEDRVGGGSGPPSQSSTLHSDPPSTLTHDPTPSSVTPPGLQHLSTTGGSPVGETTPHFSSDNSTAGNHTGSSVSDLQVGVKRNATLLVFMVASLIVALLVVVLFLVVKLRKAHVAWRKENEESGPSEDSSKSKSSQEDKNNFVKKRKGLSTFTQYVVQEPTVMVPEDNTATQTVTDSGHQHHMTRCNAVAPTPSRSEVKETSL